MAKPSYTDYSLFPAVAVDIETKDPFLKAKGPGVYRKDGYVCGVSLSNGATSEYYPLRHPGLDPNEASRNRDYLKVQLGAGNGKVFANAMYDLDWLENFEGIRVNGKLDDVQVAEPLLDEYKRTYSLGSLSSEYLGENKSNGEIDEYALRMGWAKAAGKGVEHIHKMPAEVVGGYASEDARLTFRVFEKQAKLLLENNLSGVYGLETGLFPLLLRMRKEGVCVDSDRLIKTGMILSDLSYELQADIDKIAKRVINVNSGKDLESLFNAVGLPITYLPPTQKALMRGLDKGNPSFNKQVLKGFDDPLVMKILEVRHIRTLLGLFINAYPDFIVEGKIHTRFHQLRSDEFGTVSGRFSSADPNLQQVSAKDEEEYISSGVLSGQVVRKLFTPAEDCDWLKLDWSQIEYRLIAHYALGEGADTIRGRYVGNPKTDYHHELGEMTGIPDRKKVKNLNFAGAYGVGPKRMAEMNGWTLEEARSIYEQYHSKVPFVKETLNRVAQKAKRIGFVKTVLGRKARLRDPKKAYVMFNRLIQGSAADLMKKAMKDAWEAGIFNVLIPHLTVHDELDCSMPRTREGYEAGAELKHIMETCIKLKVPIIADAEIGPNWGELKKVEEIKWE